MPGSDKLQKSLKNTNRRKISIKKKNNNNNTDAIAKNLQNMTADERKERRLEKNRQIARNCRKSKYIILEAVERSNNIEGRLRFDTFL